MSDRTPPLNHRRAVRFLRDRGFSADRHSRHGTLMTRPDGARVVLPRHGGRDYKPGLTRAIIKQASRGEQEWSLRSSSTRRAGRSGPRSPSSRGASRQAER
ncbi:MAG: type II toxin-antitoxin system HicA family toxin [Solirubrobacteraceae bacterium]